MQETSKEIANTLRALAEAIESRKPVALQNGDSVLIRVETLMSKSSTTVAKQQKK